MTRGRRARILDQVLCETGARVGAELRARAVPELSAAIKLLDDAGRKKLDRVVREMREFSTRKGLDRELAQQVLQDPVSSILGRAKGWKASNLAPRLDSSETARALVGVAGSKRPKPKFAVVSVETVAHVVVRIKEIAQKEAGIAEHFAALGLSIDEGTWLMFNVLDYSKALKKAGIQRRIDSRGGILYETVLPLHPNVVRKERAATATNASEWIRQEPGRFGVSDAQKERMAQAVSEQVGNPPAAGPSTGAVFIRQRDAAGLGDFELLARNLWLVRLVEVRDEGGRLISDHIRTLMSVSPDGKAIDLMPSGIGESKFRSGYAKVVPQVVANIRRVRETLRAANLPDLEGLEIRVRWGKALVVVVQTEKQLPTGALDDISGAVRKATRAPELKVNMELVLTPEQAFAARRTVNLFMKLAADSSVK